MNNRYLDELPTRPLAMGKVVAVCGMPGSGKGEFARLIGNHDIPVRSMGDMVRAEVASRGLEGNPTIFGEVAADLRSKFGDDILAVRLADEVDNLLKTNSIVLIEGMRGTAEYAIFTKRWGVQFSSVAIGATPEIRFQRTQSRGRVEDGDFNEFQIREERECGWGLDKLIQDSDHVIMNEKSIEEFAELCEQWLFDLQQD